MNKVAILSSGVVSSLALDVPVMSTAVQAGISTLKTYDYIASTGEPYRMSILPDECLPELQDGVTNQTSYRYRRMLQLLAVALEQLKISEKVTSPTPCFINLPEKLSLRKTVAPQTLQEINRLTGLSIDWLHSRVYHQGRAGGYSALADAYRLVSEGVVKTALVAGVDSCRCLKTLGTWESEGRLLLSHVGDGFLPGEGAGCLLLSAADENSKVILDPPGVSQEEAHYYSDQVCRGDGLTAAMLAACDQLNSPVQQIICGLNGEHSPTKEWGVAVSRLGDKLDNNASIMHPADCYGDIGAATAPVLVALSAYMLEQGDVEGPVLTWSASDYETRGAAALSIPKSVS
ncbi:3-oxoacyl-(acyl-carrier-protein) synthase [Hahella chejuensis KCTC 2396]|uniref:3-oxoacyl-(Acyl-carrier-protein) synthase n=1 Tax=Hahella chejuensis (strain KCTC 2396) TaxID=349521 RepID=Q2SAG4_HAHCH|nr:3-oxoacyl-ACP synthase [Hahella chejuensis]ABC32360.1 3-oxoacyl-(acyl-carrier-protein) synthase [Hahella chejuensis KCTC 2396]